MLRSFFTFRWILTTLLVLAAVIFMVRLGFWQLDRHDQRQAFNTQLQAQIDAPPLDLNQQPLPVDELLDMEYRQVIARGEYNPADEVVLRNQVYEHMPGYHVLTPLRLEGSEYSVLVDRGFIPLDEGKPEQRAKYAQAGVVEVRGVIRRPQNQRIFGVPDPTLAPGEERLDAWNAVNLNRIQEQIDGPVLPVYVQMVPAEGDAVSGPPYPNFTMPEIGEGSHIGYAIQWFAFAAVLGVGYPFFVRARVKDS